MILKMMIIFLKMIMIFLEMKIEIEIWLSFPIRAKKRHAGTNYSLAEPFIP